MYLTLCVMYAGGSISVCIRSTASSLCFAKTNKKLGLGAGAGNLEDVVN
jgi:hypothetical protein